MSRSVAQGARSRLPGPVAVVAVLFVAVCAPVVARGAPLADDFNNCLAPVRSGLGTFFASSAERLGAIRPARFVEILLTTGMCQNLHFGFAVAVPLVLTLVVAVLLAGLLSDLGLTRPWPQVGGALWLLQPLGTEIALWPAALHVSLGLALTLASLRLFRRGRDGWGALAALGAFLSIEQVILALPLLVALVVPRDGRRKATLVAGAVALCVFAAFLLWPGADPRLEASASERVRALFADPGFYIGYPAVGLGLHSIPKAVAWIFPASAFLLVAGAIAGALAARRAVAGSPVSLVAQLPLVSALVALVLLNLPVVLSVPRQGSPRIFAPTWLLLCAVAAFAAPRLVWARPGAVGALAGVFAAGALLSLALSASVRVDSADFTEGAARAIAGQTEDGDTAAVCGVRRTVADDAPRGAFAVHDFIYDWAAQDAVYYYTARDVEVRVAGEAIGTPCPDPGDFDAHFSFDDLIAEWART